MKGDFSRNTFDPSKHYSSVRMQQGRVQLDADWNEQMDLFDYRTRLVTEDFLGTGLAPSSNPGFGITVTTDTLNLNIGSGRYYVGGLLCENDTATTFTTQPDYPNATFPTAPQTGTNLYLVYLEVWERSISGADDPNLLEVALQGADTSVRFRNIAQVKLFPTTTDASITQLDYAHLFDPNATSGAAYTNVQNWNTMTGRLASSSISQLTPTVSSSATLLNQLYRVEIHQSGDASTATFKWSRDNASVCSQILQIQGTQITIAQVPQDEQIGFGVGQWIEVNNAANDLDGIPGAMVQISAVNGNVLTIYSWPSSLTSDQIAALATGTVRRWDSTATLVSSTPIALEDGLSISFSGSDFQTGDYWTMPSRAATNTITWPTANGSFLAQTPQGIVRYYVPLAIIEQQTNSTLTLLDDCRTILTPLDALSAIGISPNAPSDSIYIDGYGQVGIGTTTPASKLDVEGTVTINGDGNDALQVQGGNTQVDTLTINTTNGGSFSPTPGPNLVPVANSSGQISSGWLGDLGNATADTLTINTLNAGSFSTTATPNKVVVADSLGRIDSNWLGNRWLPSSTIVNMPTARAGCIAAAVNGKIYVIGGFNNSSSTLSTVEVYDPATATWVTNTPMPTARFDLGCGVVNGQIYAVGGSLNGGTTTVVEMYDPVANTWTSKTGMASEVYDFACSAFNGKIYTFGGGTPGGSLSNVVQMYDPVANTWTIKTPMPTARERCASCVANSLIYVIGGDGPSGFSNTVEAYDPIADAWHTNLAPMPTARASLSTVVVNAKIYAMGGDTGLHTVEEYNPLTNQWTSSLPSMPTGLFDFGSCMLNNYIYTFGGEIISGPGITIVNTMQIYVPQGQP